MNARDRPRTRLVLSALALAFAAAAAAPLRASAHARSGAGPIALAVRPERLALGTVYVGHARAYPVHVTNTGTRPVTIARVELPGHGLAHRLRLPATLAPGAATWFAVAYAPAAPGEVAGAITFADGAGAIVASLPVTARAERLDERGRVSVVAHGARGDGVTDDRAAFQAAADAARDAGKVLYVPRPPGGRHYKLGGVVRIHGSMVGEPGGEKPELRMYGATGADTPGGAPPHAILYYKGNRAGTVITGLHLNGGRDFAPGTNVYGMPEYSHGIVLQDVSDVWIEHNVVERTQGDSILVGGEPGTSRCEAVRIVANVLHHPMRCAIFPGDTARLRVYLNSIGKVVEYQGAIDFEPNVAPQASWDAEIAYNDFTTTLQYDHGVITSTVATRIRKPGGRIEVHDNWGAPGRYSFHVDLSAPGSSWVGNAIQPALQRAARDER